MKSLALFILGILISNICLSQDGPFQPYEVLVDKNNLSKEDFLKLKDKLHNAKEIKLDSNLSILKSATPNKTVRRELNAMSPEKVEPLGNNSYKSLFFAATPQGESKNRIKTIGEKRGDSYTVVNLAPQKLMQLSLTHGFDAEHGFAEPSFYLPLKKDSMVIVEKGRYRQEGDRTIFAGTLDQNSGEVFLISRGDSISGVINTASKTYSIVPVGNGQHIITESKAQYGDEEPKRFLEKNKQQDTQDAQDVQGPGRLEDNDRVEIRLLVLYTDKVDQFYSGNSVNELIIPSIERTNQTLFDSGVGNLKFSLAAAQKVNYVETEDWNRHLNVLTKPDDNIMDNVFALRDQVAADIVVLIVKTDGAICGEADTIGPVSEKAFVVVRASCSLNYYSFGHEIGHLFGCRHDVDVDDTDTPYRYGHGFIKKNPVPWRCVMSYGNGCNGCRRIGIWSNPHIQYQGTTAGTVDRENNVEVLKQSAKTIAAFR